MGVVYRARSPEGRDVAIKVLARTSPAALERFERERRLLASFGEASGFVPLLDAGSSPQGPYIVMPLLTGGTLRARLGAGPFGLAETLRVARALCAAIGQAHARGIIHRDLKPENVLFTADGRPLVADLGLAKHFDTTARGASQSVSLSGAGELRGTAGYMPPEQAADSKSVGPAADVFALGAIIYECLAGRPAFEAGTVVELLAIVQEARFVSLARLAPGTPPWLVKGVERALARDPGRRFPDALAMGRALVAPAGRSARRFGLAAVGIGIGLAAAVAIFPGSRPERPPAPAPAPARASPPPLHALSPSAALPAPDPAAAELVRSAFSKMKTGDFDGAIQDTTRALELDPRHVEAWVYRAGARMNKGDLDGAIEDLTRAIELAPGNALAWAGRATTKNLRHDPEGALADYKRAIECDPGLASARVGRAAILVDRGEDAAAIEELTLALEIAPGHGDTWKYRGIARSHLGDRAGAISDFERFLALAPEDPDAGRIRDWLEKGGRGDLR
jgi:tetratricopeptide (TPR) repeat protein